MMSFLFVVLESSDEDFGLDDFAPTQSDTEVGFSIDNMFSQ